MTVLAEYDPKWNVAWTHARQGSDKCMYVQFPDPIQLAEIKDHQRKNSFNGQKTKNYPVCQSFANPGRIILSFTNPSHVDHILSSLMHNIKGFTHPL